VSIRDANETSGLARNKQVLAFISELWSTVDGCK